MRRGDASRERLGPAWDTRTHANEHPGQVGRLCRIDARTPQHGFSEPYPCFWGREPILLSAELSPLLALARFPVPLPPLASR